MGATILFMDDLVDLSNADVSATSSTTEAGSGYHIDNIRDRGFGTAWKGTDSTTADVWGQYDLSVTTKLGGIGALVYCAIAYDARNNEQDVININTDDADNPAMTAQTTAVSFTLVKNGSRPAVAYATFANPGKRYWRMLLPGGARSEAAGSKVPRIYGWSFYRPTGLINVDTDYLSNTPAPGDYDLVSKVSRMITGAGLAYANSIGSVDQEFDLGFVPADSALWTALRDKFFSLGNDLKPIYMLYDGMRSDHTANFTMARLATDRWTSRRTYRDLYESRLRFVTEPWS